MNISFLLAEESFNAPQGSLTSLTATAFLLLTAISSALAALKSWRDSRRLRESQVRAVKDVIITLQEGNEYGERVLFENKRALTGKSEEKNDQTKSDKSATEALTAGSSEGADSAQELAASFNNEIDTLLTNQLKFYVKHIEGGQRQVNYLRIISLVAIVGGLFVIFAAVIGTLIGAVPAGLASGGLGALTTGIGAILFQQSKSAEANSVSDFDKVQRADEEADRLKSSVHFIMMIKSEKNREYALESLALKLALYSKGGDASDSFVSEIITNRPTLE